MSARGSRPADPVITGLGTLGPWGAGREALGRALASGEPPLFELDPTGTLVDRADDGAAGSRSGLKLDPRVRWAGRLAPEHLKPWLPAREGRRMSRPSRFAVAAARMAAEDAGYELPDGGADDLGVILSTTFGPTAVTEEMLQQIFRTGPESASPFLFAESVANAPAAQVARLLGARGANLTVTEREAGALMAVRRAAAQITAGRSARMLAGVSDEVTPVLQAILDGLGSLARGSGEGPGDSPPQARPFDHGRHGCTTAEGATVLLLESSRAASERGARTVAGVVGGGEGFDPSAPRCGWGTGHALLGRVLAGVLDRSGLGIEDVDLIVSGATGSRDGDRMEALTLRAAFDRGPRPASEAGSGGVAGVPPVVAPKAVVGELGGGHLATAVLLLTGSGLGATDAPPPGFREPDPELGITPVAPASADARAPRRVLVQSVSAGGPAAWLILERTAEAAPGAVAGVAP